jgi:hypothetical protein
VYAVCDGTASDCPGNIVRQRLPHVSGGPNMMIASLADLINMLIN